MSSYPRVMYCVGWFEAWFVRSIELGASFNVIIFFCYAGVAEDGGVPPQEVLEVEWAGGDSTAFVEVMNEVGLSFVCISEERPTVVLEMS